VLNDAGSTSDNRFVEESSLRGLAAHVAKSWCKYQKYRWYNELVTNYTTPYIYRKVTLVVTFRCSIWIIMNLYMGDVGIAVSIVGKMGLIAK
jgi:hypothetical protein